MNILRKKIWRVVYASSVKWLPRSCYSLISRKLRGVFAKRILSSCGLDPNIDRGATFGHEVSLGDYSNIGYMCEVHGKVFVGSHVMMAPRVRIYTVNHRTDSLDIPMDLQGNDEMNPVSIGDDCWIGDGAIILPGVHIGSHSIVGAGAVVTKSFPDFSVIGGVPAKCIKMRK